jgi:hypothetical protein
VVVLPVSLFSIVSGYRIVPLLLFASGFTIFSFFSYGLLWSLGSPEIEIWLAIVLAFGGGLLGGVLLASLKRIGKATRVVVLTLTGILLYALLSGILFGTLIPATPVYPYLKHQWVPAIFMGFFGVAALIPFWKWEKQSVIVGYLSSFALVGLKFLD